MIFELSRVIGLTNFFLNSIASLDGLSVAYLVLVRATLLLGHLLAFVFALRLVETHLGWYFCFGPFQNAFFSVMVVVVFRGGRRNV